MTKGTPRPRQSGALRYLLTCGASALLGQVLLAQTAVQAHLVVPFARWQGRIVERLLVGGPLTVNVDPSCSALDVIALCAAATLAYPVAWSRRLTGALLGIIGLLALNAVRIASLASASQSSLFQTLHLHVWPTLLVVATGGWILWWIRSVEQRGALDNPAVRRFVGWAAVLVAAYAVVLALLAETQVLTAAARTAADTAALVLQTVGLQATVNQQLLQVGAMHYLVTPDCVVTPLLPLYLAAVLSIASGWRWRVAAIAAAVPLFACLAVLRLLTVAVPMALAGPSLVMTHAFNQILAGVATVLALALWPRGPHTRPATLLVAGAVSAAFVTVLIASGPLVARVWTWLLTAMGAPVPPGLSVTSLDGDGQGALLLLPAFQLCLLAATLLVSGITPRSRWWLALSVLVVAQLVTLLTLGWLSAQGVQPPPALLIRAWALILPFALVSALRTTSSAHPATS